MVVEKKRKARKSCQHSSPKRRRNLVCGMEGDIGKKSKEKEKQCREKVNTTQVGKPSIEKWINLFELAKDAWKECYGQDMPKPLPFGDSFPKVGMLWTQGIQLNVRETIYTTQYPPSLLDATAERIPDDFGVGFRKQKDATSALLWWIICTKQSAKSRRRWAAYLLGNAEKALLYTKVYSRQVWCTLSRDHRNGKIWLEYKGRKCVFV